MKYSTYKSTLVLPKFKMYLFVVCTCIQIDFLVKKLNLTLKVSPAAQKREKIFLQEIFYSQIELFLLTLNIFSIRTLNKIHSSLYIHPIIDIQYLF